MELVLASTNPHKLHELREFMGGLGVEVLAPAAVGGLPPVREDAPTFAGNARKKAVSAARAAARWALADDSGLEVAALGGAPGVRSARFAGDAATDAENNALLLERLASVPSAERDARFVCALCLADPTGTPTVEVAGEARGRILTSPRGSNGFGYDPLFLYTGPEEPASGRTFAELSRAEKSRVSHRGRALRALAAEIERLAATADRWTPR